MAADQNHSSEDYNMNIAEIIKEFPTQKKSICYLEKIRWGKKVKCVYCNSTNVYKRTSDLRHHCNNCEKSFSVTIGTIFEDTRVELQKWFILIGLMLNAKKGLSACQAARDIGMRRPTVWSMMHRIRQAMGTDEMKLLSGIVEMDETYVGGKPRKESKDKDDDGNYPTNKRGRGTKKECVVGMVERDGSIKAKHMAKNMLKGIDLMDLVRKHVDADNSTLMTDEYKAYSKMKNIITHLSVNHSAREYARKDNFHNVHTNTIEGFWALLKRGIIGQFHKVSKKYLYRYIDESCFRYNQRKNDYMFDMLMGRY